MVDWLSGTIAPSDGGQGMRLRAGREVRTGTGLTMQHAARTNAEPDAFAGAQCFC